MPFAELQIHVSIHSSHVSPKGEAPVGVIPDSLIPNQLLVLIDSNNYNH